MKTSYQSTGIQFSRHSMLRLGQRGIKTGTVMTVIARGTAIHKQSLKFLFIPKKKMKGFTAKEQAALSKLIVVTNKEKTEVITCYKSEKAVHKIRKKPKRLGRIKRARE